MTDRPILFGGSMVGAILDGRKTQTRRVIQAESERLICRKCGCSEKSWKADNHSPECSGELEWTACDLPKFQIGDRLWVRETWTTRKGLDDVKPSDINKNQSVGYIASDEGPWQGKIRPSIFMPRWASRITLIVTDVRVQRLQEINRGDAMAEGFPGQNMAKGPDPREWFRDLWDSINADRGYGWDANPWVVAISFDPIFQNIDVIGGGE